MSVQSIDRAFTILNVIAETPDNTGVTAIGEMTGLHKATVSRLLSTLESLGAVERLPNNEGFRIGEAILDLARQIDPITRLINISKPYLQELADITGEAVSLEIPDGESILYVDQVQTQHHIRVNSWIGRRYPIHSITSAPLFLSNWSDRSIRRYFSVKLSQPTDNTIVKYETMRTLIDEVEHLGYAYARDQYELGLTGLSAPITNQLDNHIAAINVCGPSFRFPQDGNFTNFVNRTKQAANAISALITQTQQDDNWELKELEPQLW